MANQAGKGGVPHFDKGSPLLASDLNKLADAAVGRVIGAGGTEILATKAGVIVKPGRSQTHPAPNTIVVELGAPYTEEDAEEGEYEFTLYKGSGPDTGRVIELLGREGLPAGLRVIARRAAGLWYFDGAFIPVRYGITAIDDDTLTVKLLESADGTTAGLSLVEEAPELTIWKALELQKQSYNGLTIDGVSYTYVSAQARTGTEGATTEDQIITPPYVVGPPFRSHSIVVASVVANGGYSNGPLNRMMDENRAGRAWSKEATA